MCNFGIYHVSYTREAERSHIASVCLYVTLGDKFLYTFQGKTGAPILMKFVGSMHEKVIPYFTLKYAFGK